MTTPASLDQKLTQLRLGRMRDVYQDWVQYAETHQLSYQESLDELLTEELLGRQERQLRKRLEEATFPYGATLEQFDFTLRPELKCAVIINYFDSSFIAQARSLLLILIRFAPESKSRKLHAYPIKGEYYVHVHLRDQIGYWSHPAQ